MGETLIILQLGAPVVISDVATFIGTGTAGTAGACRRLTFPSGIVDGAGADIDLVPIIYSLGTTGRCFNPTRSFGLDNVVLPHPITDTVRTLGTTRVVRFEEQDDDVIITEIWDPDGGASMPTSFFRTLYEYLLNARFIPSSGSSYIQWEPRERNADTFNVEILSLSVGGGRGESQFDVSDITGDNALGSATDIDHPLDKLSPTATGLIDREVRLRMRIVNKV